MILLLTGLSVVYGHACCNPGPASCGESDTSNYPSCVCTFDPYCCVTFWDSQCVQEASVGCQLDCTTDCAPQLPGLPLFAEQVYTPEVRGQLDHQKIYADVTKLLNGNGEYSVEWNSSALAPKETVHPIECAPLVEIVKIVVVILLQKIACCDPQLHLRLDTKELSKRMIFNIGEKRLAEYIFAITVPLTMYSDEVHVEAALRLLLSWVVSDDVLGWAGFMRAFKDLISSEHYVVMGVAGTKWWSEVDGTPPIDEGLVQRFGKRARLNTDTGACGITHYDLSKSDLAIYLKFFYDNEVTNKTARSYKSVVDDAHIRIATQLQIQPTHTHSTALQRRRESCEEAIVDLVIDFVGTIFAVMGVVGEAAESGIKMAFEGVKGALSGLIAFFKSGAYKTAEGLLKIANKVSDVLSFYEVWKSIKAQMHWYDILLDVVTVIATLASWFVTGGGAFLIALAGMVAAVVGDVFAVIEVINDCDSSEVFPTLSPTPSPTLPPNYFCPTQDNSQCADDYCERTTRDGDYLCCANGDYLCWAWTSGDCKSAFHYCNGFLGHGVYQPPDDTNGNVFTQNSGAGQWGGSCQCPNGEVFQVGDNNNACGSMACSGGTPGTCNHESGPWSGNKVDCKLENVFSTTGGGGWGGSCQCPDGNIYQVGDEDNSCGSLSCYGGTSGKCNEYNGDWSGNTVTCAKFDCVCMACGGNNIKESANICGHDQTCIDDASDTNGCYGVDVKSQSTDGTCNCETGVWTPN